MADKTVTREPVTDDEAVWLSGHGERVVFDGNNFAWVTDQGSEVHE